MSDQYLLIRMEHLKEAWLRGKEISALEQALPARLEGGGQASRSNPL